MPHHYPEYIWSAFFPVEFSFVTQQMRSLSGMVDSLSRARAGFQFHRQRLAFSQSPSLFGITAGELDESRASVPFTPEQRKVSRNRRMK